MKRQSWQRIAFRLFLICAMLLLACEQVSPAAAGAAISWEFTSQGNSSMAALPALPDAVQTLNFTTIVVGAVHTCALLSGGGVQCWGYNSNGQLGDGMTIRRSTPVNVAGLATGVTAITAGLYHTCALLSGGGVKCWGYNYYGQLGNGTTDNHNTPVDVSGLSSGVIAIAAGYEHTCALLSGGGVKCWGYNEYGQLGDGTTTNRSTPVSVTGLSSGVTTLAAGGYHTCAQLASGGIKCWGANGYGQLGDGTTNNRSTPVSVTGLSSGVTTIAAGEYHTCAVLSGGGVKCWGWNYFGQLGDGTTNNRSTPVNVAGLSSGVTVIAAGLGHTCARLSGSGIKCWGWNGYGQLGDGTTTTRSTPVDVTGLSGGATAVAAGGYHSCARLLGGGAQCWGDNEYGQLGNGSATQRSTPVDVAGLSSGVTAIALGGGHTCARLVGGGIQCWGGNGYGQLGDGTTISHSTPADVTGLASGVTAITTGDGHTCAQLSGGGVKCWGWNYFGQLGDGTTTQRSTPVDVTGLTSGVTAIAAGGDHTCALLSDGGVQCWGFNNYGQLGDGTTNNRSTPVDVTGLTSGVTAIAAGMYHTCALLAGGGARCWGDNWYGQLGDGTMYNQHNTPVDVAGLSGGVTTITAGGYHTCAVLSGGGAQCWGYNGYGQLGDGTMDNHSTPVDVSGLASGGTAIATGYFHTCALVSDGGMKCWGDNEYGQLGDGTTTQRSMPADVAGLASGVLAITAGKNHTCALVADGRPKCWGSDTSGQLGVGTILQRLTPVDVVESAPASLTTNYPTGQPGSFLTITGWNFPPSTQATLSINGQVITSTLPVSPTGSFIFFLDATGANAGSYTVTINLSIIVSFILDENEPLRSQEGGGQTFLITYKRVFLPAVTR